MLDRAGTYARGGGRSPRRPGTSVRNQPIPQSDSLHAIL